MKGIVPVRQNRKGLKRKASTAYLQYFIEVQYNENLQSDKGIFRQIDTLKSSKSIDMSIGICSNRQNKSAILFVAKEITLLVLSINQIKVISRSENLIGQYKNNSPRNKNKLPVKICKFNNFQKISKTESMRLMANSSRWRRMLQKVSLEI